MKKSNDQKQLENDFSELCKKHKLTKAALLLQTGGQAKEGTFTAMANATNKTMEKRFLKSLATVISKTGFDPKSLDATSMVLDSLYVKNRVQELSEKLDEAKLSGLSKKDRTDLEKYRKLKHELVEKKDYEKASQYRQKERDLLEKANLKTDMKSFTEFGNILADITKITALSYNKKNMTIIKKILSKYDK